MCSLGYERDRGGDWKDLVSIAPSTRTNGWNQNGLLTIMV